MPDAPTPVEKLQNGNTTGVAIIDSLGDVQGFGLAVLYSALGLLVIGYVGANTINICNMTGREIDDLFPTDLQNFPYETPIGRTNPSGDSISKVFSDFHASRDPESLTRATLEFLYPMKRQSFPYSSWFLSEAFQGHKGHTIAQWYASTCAGTFATWRSITKKLIVMGKWFYAVIHTIADYFLFYLFPVIAIYFIVLPIVPMIGFILCWFTSIMYNIPGGWIFTFAPVMGVLMAIANVFSGGVLNIFAWIMSFMIFIFGFVMGGINLAWWIIVGVALWLYVVMFLIVSPLLHKGGFNNIVIEFKKKLKSLSIVFIILVLVAATQKLNAKLQIGFGIGAAISILMIIFKKDKKSAEMKVALDLVKAAKDAATASVKTG
jgi:hypothetical protein